MRRLLPLLLLGACISPIELSEKRCPCAPGFVCDLARDRCVDTACSGAVSPADFRAEWATSNTIRFRWTPSGDRTQLVRYELRVAETAELLATTRARVYGPRDNPELGSFTLPFTNDVDDLVDHTVAWGLEPQQSYVGQLWAFDSSLCVFRTPAVAKSTRPGLPNEVMLFRDAQPAGSSYLPSSFGDAPDDTGPGRHLEWVPDRDPLCASNSEGVCGENLRLRDLGVSLAGIPPGGFVDAVLEFRIANEGTILGSYGRTWLALRGCSEVFRLEPMAIAPSAEYRTVQVPLGALSNGTRPLARGDLQADGGSTVCEFNVGGRFSRTAADGGSTRIRIDDVRVRY